MVIYETCVSPSSSFINLGCIFYLPPCLYIPLMKSRFFIILLCICGPACLICEIQVIISYRLIHMKEEAWKKSSRSRLSTKEAFKIKVDCTRQFFFLGLVHDHLVWYIYIYMIYVDVLIGMCTICISLYIYTCYMRPTY